MWCVKQSFFARIEDPRGSDGSNPAGSAPPVRRLAPRFVGFRAVAPPRRFAGSGLARVQASADGDAVPGPRDRVPATHVRVNKSASPCRPATPTPCAFGARPWGGDGESHGTGSPSSCRMARACQTALPSAPDPPSIAWGRSSAARARRMESSGLRAAIPIPMAGLSFCRSLARRRTAAAIRVADHHIARLHQVGT